MKPIRASVATALLLIATVTFATERNHTGTLKFVYPLASGDFVIAFDVEPTMCSSPSSPKNLYVSVGQNSVTATGSTKLYAAALLALTTRQTVSIAYDDATSNCFVNRMTVLEP